MFVAIYHLLQIQPALQHIIQQLECGLIGKCVQTDSVSAVTQTATSSRKRRCTHSCVMLSSTCLESMFVEMSAAVKTSHKNEICVSCWMASKRLSRLSSVSVLLSAYALQARYFAWRVHVVILQIASITLHSLFSKSVSVSNRCKCACVHHGAQHRSSASLIYKQQFGDSSQRRGVFAWLKHTAASSLPIPKKHGSETQAGW